MSKVEEGISATLAYANDDSHGYTLHCRDYSIGTDCAGLMRYYAAHVENVDVDSYPDFGTWSEVDTLTARGWVHHDFNYSNAQRGDIFVRALGDSTGHTVLYLGNGQIVGAEANKDGVDGDSSGREICQKAYYAYSYNHILRPADEWFDNAEAVASRGVVSNGFAGLYEVREDGGMNVRDMPSVDGTICATFSQGYRVRLMGKYWVTHENIGTGAAQDWCWGSYIGTVTGRQYYICAGRYTGKNEDDDFLVKIKD